VKTRIEQFLRILKNADIETLNKSVDQCHADGLFSLVFGGEKNGLLTRAFIAKKRIKPFDIALHSHCYSLNLTAIKGVITHHEAIIDDDSNLSLEKHEYHSPLNGGSGISSTNDVEYLKINSFYLPITASTYLTSSCIHTVSCEAGSIWVVEENGVDKEKSAVYGKSFVTDNLYQRPLQYQINDAIQVLRKALEECN
jgi:hypothetical protein